MLNIHFLSGDYEFLLSVLFSACVVGFVLGAAVFPLSSSESQPSIASSTSESSPYSSSIAKRSYSDLANLSHSE
jgi:hypothetical protein